MCSEDVSLLHGATQCQSIFCIEAFGFIPGHPEHDLLLQSTEEVKCIFDVWREDELICEEINVPQEKSDAKFNLETFSDSSLYNSQNQHKIEPR